MAKKKSTVDELKELIEATPKANILTKEQLQTLRDISTDLMNVRSTLEDLEGEDEISKIMFRIGMMYNVSSKAETILDELIDSYDENCDECDDNY